MNPEALAQAILAASKANTIECPHCRKQFEPKSTDWKTSEQAGETGNNDDSNDSDSRLDGAEALARRLISAARKAAQ